jgi:ABC-type Mn2+/Zn2+ transport system ATPase subunit
MKLINWHYLTDVTIDIKGNCLITGDNGTGKSTALDAIQYVLTGGRAKFNSAAHEKTKRDLLGYVRCKTGRDTNKYERQGDVTSHVALEFYEEGKKRSFILGAVIDSSSDLSNPKTLFYRIENQRIVDQLFITNDIPKNINQFKISSKSFKAKILTTQTAARDDFNNRLGSLGYRFFDLLTKALSFKPIDNVKDFVYSYILDEKEVNIDYLKENVRTYMEFEKVLKGIKLKLGRLEEIQSEYDELHRIEENIKIHDFIILKSQKDMEEIKLIEKNLSYQKKHGSLAKEKEKELEINDSIERLRKRQSDIRQSLLTNDTYILINNLENEIDLLKKKKAELKIEDKRFDKELGAQLEKIKELYDLEIKLEGIKDFVRFSNELTNEEGKNKFYNNAFTLEESFNSETRKFNEELFELKSNKKKIEEKLSKIEEEIHILESKRLVYDKKITDLQNVIAKELGKLEGRNIEPKIICELLEISDGRWQDAIEGYLNTQRFNLIIEPQYFDESLRAYERFKSSNNIYGVGLINTQKLEKYKECDEKSLAAVVTSKNKFAKYYINMIMGKVIRCESVDDLKKHSRSITPTCMVYQNNTARQINPKIYEKPYIGSEAYKRQLKLKLEEKENLKKEQSEINNKINHLEDVINLLSKPRFEYLRENCDIKIKLMKKEDEILLKKEQLNQIDKSTILELDFQLKKISKDIKESDLELKNIRDYITRLKVEIENLEEETKYIKSTIDSVSVDINNYEMNNAEVLSKANERYEATIKQKTPYEIYYNYSRSRQGFDTRLSNKENDLKHLQRDYNNEFHFGGSEGKLGIEDFLKEYKNLKESKVIEYEEKIYNARQKAEEEFKEHFLAKLQENIVSAQNEFKKLNEALRGISFGEDEYKFQYTSSKVYDKFYKMIMDENNLVGNNLLTGMYRQKHKEAMDELFDRITVDNDESRKALEKFTDYRTFMDYDIRIYHSDGSTSSFSKVCREKSGGETQTPYYVAIAASFIQLYDSGLHEDKLGIILLDEAFNNMDENRIESMMEFLNKLDLQLIIAAPPQKIESIGPHMDTTLVVSKEDNFSWVEAFSIHEEL